MARRHSLFLTFSMLLLAVWVSAPATASDGEFYRASAGDQTAQAKTDKAAESTQDAEKTKKKAEPSAAGSDEKAASTVTPAVGTVEDIFRLRSLDLAQLETARSEPASPTDGAIVWREVR